jgi:nitrous oxidase accessory protein NosD
MKKIILFLIFQILFLVHLFSQTPNNRFILAWYDYSHINTSIATMSQNYKNMQTDYFNCAITEWRLIRVGNQINPPSFQYASSEPSKAFMDSTYKYNIKVMLSTPDNSVLINKDADTLYNHYDSKVSQEGLMYWGNHPALLGFDITDEPYMSHYQYILPYANDIRNFNPNLLRYVNLLPAYFWIYPNYSAYEQNLQDYIDLIQPNILSFDRYPLLYPETPNDLFYSLDIVSRKSVENNIPFNYVFTSLNEVFQNLSYYVTGYFMHAGLCYGAKGLSHWNSSKYLSNFSSNHRAFVKNINKKILDNEDVLLSLQFKSAYHKNVKSTIRDGNDSIPLYSTWQYFSSDSLANEIFKVSNPLIAQPGSTIDSLAVSLMTDNFGNRYFWIFNKSLSASENVGLNLKDDSGVVDILSNNSCLLSQTAVIHLEPTEAKLYKFVPNQNTPATNTITENTVWKSKRVVYEKIVVASSSTLTVKDTVFLSANTSITIQPGGKLIIDGGVLTNACSGALWQGITVWGDPNLPPNTLYQGYVQVINGGKIENAQCGITVKAGGIVTGTNAHFVNNTIGVFFDDQSNGGSFTRTNFELNDNYLGETGSGVWGDKRDFEAHIKMWNSGNVTVTGCNFTSTAPYYRNSRNIGISSLNSFLEVKEYCTKTPLSGKFCNESDMTRSRFQGLTLGVKSYNFGTLPRLKVRFSIFEDNLKGGIEFNYSNYLEMIKNEFIVTQSGSYGLYVSGATGYKIEENEFLDNLPAANKETIGLKIGGSGSPENEVYKNIYENLYIAQQFMGKNSSLVDTTGSGGTQPIKDKIPPVTGLQTLCNVFTNSRFRDIYAGYFPATHNRNSIRTNQGALLSLAGNWFYGNPPLNIDYTLSQHEINYYYDVNAPNSFPSNVTNNVTTIPATASNGCPSKIGNNPPPTKSGYNEFLTQALRQYDEWNEQYEYWLARWYEACGEEGEGRKQKAESEEEDLTVLRSYDLTVSEECEYILQMISYYSALKDNYFNSIIVAAMSEEGESRKQKAESEEENLTFLRSYALTVFENLRYLFSYRNNYTDNLCIVETYLAENNKFGEALTSLSKMVNQFELDEEQIFELKGLEIYIHWLQQLEEREKTIYSLPEEDIMQLVNYVETNTGCGVAFAKGILCGVYDICLEEKSGDKGEKEKERKGEKEDEMIRGLDDEMISQSKSAQSVSSEFQNSITLVPNPTTGELQITNYELQITNIEVFDVYGRKLSPNHLIISSSHHLINISHLQSGIYFVKIITEAGEVIKKVVKN